MHLKSPCFLLSVLSQYLWLPAAYCTPAHHVHETRSISKEALVRAWVAFLAMKFSFPLISPVLPFVAGFYIGHEFLSRS